MVAQGFDAWWPQHKLAVHGYVEVLRHYREIVGHPRGAGRAAAGHAAARPSSASTRRISTSVWRRGCKQCGHQDHPLRLPVDLGLARRARQAHRAQRATTCCACSPSSPSCCSAHGVAATYVGHPLADVIPLQVPRAASARCAGPGRARRGGGAAAGQPPRRDRATSRRRSCRPPCGCSTGAPSCASCCRWRRACARLLDAADRAARAGAAAAAARRPARTTRWRPAT